MTFAISEATVYNWTKQDKIDRGEVEGISTDQGGTPRARVPVA